MKKIISVEGMHCMHCAQSVENALCAVEGIISAKVNLDKKECVAGVKGEVADEAIREAISGAGFEVTDIVSKKSLF